MSTEASQAINAKAPALPAQATSTTDSQSAGVPKKIVNAQTVCNVKNEKGKLCNGHLKQLHTGGEEAAVHLRGDDVLFKCQVCGTLYMGPPLGHVRDPDKQARFVQAELTELLQAAGGTMPIIKKNEKGVYVLAEPVEHKAAPSKPAANASMPAPQSATATASESPEEKKARLVAEAAARKASANAQAAMPASTSAQPAATSKPAAASAPASLGPIPGASGPVPGETQEQKLARLRGVVAELKRRKEAAGGVAETASDAVAATPPAVRTKPTLASTSGADSSPSADEHRAEAEAQAATGQASAVPMNPAAANASPAGIEAAASNASPPAAPKAASSSRDFDTGPVPGETHEQKIARLQAVVAAAKERGEREGRVKA